MICCHPSIKTLSADKQACMVCGRDATWTSKKTTKTKLNPEGLIWIRTWKDVS